MPFDIPVPPSIEGLTYLEFKPVFFTDRRKDWHETIPVYHYRDDATGELVLVTEDRYEEILDRLIVMGAFGCKESQG